MKKIVVLAGLLSLLFISPVKAQKDTSDLPVIDTLLAYTQKAYMSGKYGEMKPKLDSAEVMLMKIYPDSLHDRVGSLFSLRGDYYLNAESDFLEAIEDYKRAANINYILYGENLYYSALNNNIGRCYKRIADYDNAVKHYNIDQRVLRKLKGEYCMDMGIAYNVMGDLYTEKGYYQKAVSVFNKSINIITEVGGENHPNLVYTYNNMGLVLKYMGNYRQSEAFYQKALQIALAKIKNRPFMYTHLYNNLAKLKVEESKYKESIELYNKGYKVALETFGERHPVTANFMKSMAQSYMYLNKKEETEDFINRSISVLTDIYGDKHPDVGLAYDLKAKYYNFSGNLDSSYVYCKKTFDIVTKTYSIAKEDYFQSYINMAIVLIKLERYTEAEKILNEAISIYIKNEDVLDEHNHLIPEMNHIYKMLFIVEHHLGNKEEALSALEKSISGKRLHRSHEKYLFEEYASDNQKEEYEQLERMISYTDIKRKQYARKRMVKKSLEMNDEYNRLVSSRRSLEKSVISSNPRYHTRPFNQLFSYDKIVQDKILDKDQCALYYVYFDKKIYYVVLSNKRLDIVEKEVDNMIMYDAKTIKLLSSKAAIEDGIYEVNKNNRITYMTSTQIKKYFGVRTFVNEYLVKKSPLMIADIEKKLVEYNNRLYKNLIEPIESNIKGFKDIVIITSNGLDDVPLNMLYKSDNGEKSYFIEEYNVQNVSSLAIFADKKARKMRYDKLKRKKMLAIGISDFVIKGDSLFAKYANKTDKELVMLETERDYQRYRSVTRSSLGGEFINLKNAVKEVNTISNLMADDKNKGWVLTNSDATEIGVKSLNKVKELKKAEMIHISTHGAISNNNVEKSSLVMYDYTGMGPSDDIIANDGYLTIKEILQFDLNSDLVVLSACETSLGETDIQGNLYGLIYAFYLAGSNNIIASNWEVDDKSTSAFFIEFYTRLKSGESVSEALNNVYRCFATADKKRSRNRMKPESKELKELLKDKKYSDPFYWAAFGLY